MRHIPQAVLGAVVVGLLAGCRTAAHMTEMPRVDLELQGAGNRGYLVGTPPEAGPLKTTREMVAADIEIPTLYKAKVTRTPVSLETGETAPVIPDVTQPEWQAPTQFDTYVVQKGESLWTIAAKPEIYGRATQWRRIFDANRDILKSPDRVKAGMKLRIPRGEDAGGTTYGDEGGGYQKK
jgi:hypothetical protein